MLTVPLFRSALFVFLTFTLSLAAYSQTKTESGFVDVGGSNIYYESAGKGPVVVLIHGGLVDSRVWNGQFEKFAKHFHVIRYDLRGFGKSGFSYGPFSHVDDLYNLLKHFRIEKASLVGLSLGAIIAADFTLMHPEMVANLVVTSPGLRAGTRSFRNAEAAAIYKAAEEKGRDKAIEMWLDHPFYASGKRSRPFVRLARQMLEDNYRYWGPTPQTIQLVWPKALTIDRLGDIKVPTLIVTGSKDAPEIDTVAGLLNAGIAGSSRRIIKNTGHHLVMEKPRKYNRIVLDFLRKK